MVRPTVFQDISRRNLLLGVGGLLPALVFGLSTRADPVKRWQTEENPVVVLASALPPEGQAVIFVLTLTITDGNGRTATHVALCERSRYVIHVLLEEPPEFEGIRIFIRNNIIRIIEKRRGLDHVSGVLRSFDHLPLAQLMHVMFLDLQSRYTLENLVDSVIDGRLVRALQLKHVSAAVPFEIITIYYDEDTTIPVRSVFFSKTHTESKLTADYSFAHQVQESDSFRPFVSRIVVREEPTGRVYELNISEPKFVEEWKIERLPH